MTTSRLLAPMLLASCVALGGCADLLNQQPKKAADPFAVTEAKVQKAQRQAEADPTIESVRQYANAVATYAFDNPNWDATVHVARLDRLIATCEGQATSEREKGKVQDTKAIIRIAARDVPGAKSIYRKRFETDFNTSAFAEYLDVLAKLSGVAEVNDECRSWYGRSSDQERRYDVAGQCKKALQTREDDGLAWLPPGEDDTVKEEFVIRSAEHQVDTGKMNREQARREGRYISAYYRGMVDIQVQSRCSRTVFLAGSAAPRAPLGRKIPIEAKSSNNTIQLQADHLLWLLDENDRRIAVSRMGMWDSGLSVTSNCQSIIPVR